MKIIEFINRMKGNALNIWNGNEIQEKTTRDQILYGDANQECTGVISTCYASCDVIRQAGELGYNFLVVHESLFWNHGDHIDWLVDRCQYFRHKKSNFLCNFS